MYIVVMKNLVRTIFRMLLPTPLGIPLIVCDGYIISDWIHNFWQVLFMIAISVIFTKDRGVPLQDLYNVSLPRTYL
jgi:hypothetical protein